MGLPTTLVRTNSISTSKEYRKYSNLLKFIRYIVLSNSRYILIA